MLSFRGARLVAVGQLTGGRTVFPGLLFLAVLLLGTSASAATHGTQIENTARIDYTVSGVGGQTATSNTETFVVEGMGVNDSASLQVTPDVTALFAGDPVNLTIGLGNTGDNALTGGSLIITAPPGSAVTIAGVMVSESSPGVYRYPLADLPAYQTFALQAKLIPPVDAPASSSPFRVDYQANGAIRATTTLPLQLKARTRALLELMQYAPVNGVPPMVVNLTSHQLADGNFALIPAPSVPAGGGALVTDAPLPLLPADTFQHNQILFIRLTDADQNRDAGVQEQVEIEFSVPGNADQETLRLLETAPDSGLFSGYVALSKNAAQPYDGVIHIIAGKAVQASYTDSTSLAEVAEAVALVDPFGRLFDSNSGTLLDGYTIHLLDAATGQPATVYGDDGVSSYPAILTSGGSATDGSGTEYDFGPGEYRFPLVAAGSYQLVVVPPEGARYHWPSEQMDELMAALPNGPFALDTGSRGEVFNIQIGPPLNLDLPLDSMDTLLFVRRSAGKAQVAPGDLLPFRVEVENSVDELINNVLLIDRLPPGFRYRSGTARADDAPLADPVISADGRQLTFSLGEIPAQTNRRISYIATVGSVRPGREISRSRASGNGGAIISNESSISTRIDEELMRSRAILMGRVFIEPSDNGGEEWQGKGLAGIRLYLEDGSYTVTDEQGQYHFAGVTPGTHVLQLDLDTLPEQYELIPVEKNTRFAGRPWSRFVELQGGALWRADFHVGLKPHEQGSVQLALTNDPEIRDGVVQYRLKLGGQAAELKNLHLMVMLPEGASYQAGSTDGAGDPAVGGNALTWRLEDTPAQWQKLLAFRVRIAGLKPGKAVNTRAMLLFDTPQKKGQRSAIAKHWLTPPRPVETARKLIKFSLRLGFGSLSAELGADDRAMLDILIRRMRGKSNINLTVVGHSDNRPLRSAVSRERFGDNYRLSRQRAASVARYIMDKLEMSDLPVSILGRGPDDPVANNDTRAGRAANRRVDLYIQADEVIESLQMEQPQTASILEKIVAAIIPSDGAEALPEKENRPLYDEAWLQGAVPGLEWLSPPEDALPAIPSVHIAIKHGYDERVELLLNGEPVQTVNFEGISKNRRGTVAVSSWRGVDLAAEDNWFEAVIYDATGRETGRLERNIHFSGPPVRGELVPSKSLLIADGVTPPVITVRLFDRQGYPVREGSIGEYRIAPPYQAARRTDFQRTVLPGAPAQRRYYRTGRNGEVRIRLQPTTETGEVRIKLPFVRGEQGVFSANLQAKPRDWILVGMAEGTVGYNALNGHGEPLQGGGDEDLYHEGRVAFFAKGRIKGEWLLTMAYDSAKRKPESRLFGTIQPDAYYTIYGDASRQNHEAASQEKLYLKLERDSFYALFGDFDTRLADSELSRYSRSLTGFKARYHGQEYDIVLFGSDSSQAFVRDEIRGQGSTGPYRLSRSEVVRNSEQITVEVRDRFQSEQIVEHRTLTRFVDYDIDYDRGVLNLREPLFSVDAALNHIFIIARYESLDPGDSTLTWGGRAELAATRQNSIGVTHVDEGVMGGTSQLSGVDVEHRFNSNTRLHMELAQTRKQDSSGRGDSSAWLAEIKHRAKRWDGRAWVRRDEEGFGLKQRNSASSGTRKMGAEGGYRVGNGVTLKGKAYRNSNLVTGAERDLAEVRSELLKNSTTLKLGARSVRDRRADGNRQASDQMLTGISHRTLGRRLNLRLDNDYSLSGAESIDFPNRTRIGVDYLVATATTLFAEQEWTDGAVRATTHIRLGVKASPWTGSNAFTTLKQTRRDGITATTANVGLRQKWKLNKLWSLDAGAEQARVISGRSADPLNSNAPFANGAANDFSAASLGLTYNPGNWLWNGRVEKRDSDREDRWTLVTSAQTTLRADLSLLASLRLQDSRAPSGTEKRNEKLHLALAWRPERSRWLLLNRLELINEKSRGSLDNTSQRIINNLNSYYRASEHLQLGLQYGAKYLTETISGSDYRGRADLWGVESRYDITPRWDIGLHGSLLQIRDVGQQEYSSGASVGHSFVDNIWMSLGYNFNGFYDEDFSRSRYTMEGPFIKFRMKFDQQSVRELVNWAGR